MLTAFHQWANDAFERHVNTMAATTDSRDVFRLSDARSSGVPVGCELDTIEGGIAFRWHSSSAKMAGSLRNLRSKQRRRKTMPRRCWL